MDSTTLRHLVEIQYGPQAASSEPLAPLAAPARAIPRTYPGAPQKAESVELERFPGDTANNSLNGTAPTGRDEDLEMSRPASPEPSLSAVEAMPSVWDPYMNRFRLLAVCLANFGNALSDSAAGALIPYMEK